ncbi:MAG: transporter substrate-binding domain-containing protein [Candidatus Dormibacteraceae bacterium]
MKKQVLLIGAALLVGACGSSPTTSNTPPAPAGPSTVAAIAGEVPSDIKSLAPFQIATDATYAPNEFVNPDTGAIQGWDIDLGQAICKVLGVACTFNNVTFDDIIAQLKASTPSEQAGGDKPRYLLSISSWTPTQNRENGGIDFITYYKAGESWLVKVGGTATINTAADMCGHTVAVEAGTTEESDAWGMMGKSVGGAAIAGDKDNCPAGKDITVASFGTQTEANSALLSGRADFGWLDQPVADYQVHQSNGKLKIGGQACSVSPYGIALVKGSALEKPITDAVKYLIDNNNYYKSVLNRWGVGDGAIASSDVALNNNSSIGPTCVPSY